MQILSYIEGDPLTDLYHRPRLYHGQYCGGGVAYQHKPRHYGDGAEVYYAALGVDSVDSIARQLRSDQREKVGYDYHTADGYESEFHSVEVVP